MNDRFLLSTAHFLRILRYSKVTTSLLGCFVRALDCDGEIVCHFRNDKKITIKIAGKLDKRQCNVATITVKSKSIQVCIHDKGPEQLDCKTDVEVRRMAAKTNAFFKKKAAK